MNKKSILFLIPLNIAWSISAIIYDWSNIQAVPLYLWPFFLICSTYPLVLAVHWFLEYKNKANRYVLSLAALPSSIYLLGGILYYPAWMIYNGWNWFAFGQIFWVAFYGIQGIYLLRMKNSLTPNLLAAGWLSLSLTIQLTHLPLTLFDFSRFRDYEVKAFVSLLCLSAIILAVKQPFTKPR